MVRGEIPLNPPLRKGETFIVIPASAGIQKCRLDNNVLEAKESWIPAYAGMTGLSGCRSLQL